jgi:glycogen phosphorylase
MKKTPLSTVQTVYFTMEIGLEASMPTYAGGLGMLAADIMRSSADIELSVACITMGWEHGYLRQHIRADGTQEYNQIDWNKSEYLQKLPQEVVVQVQGRDVHVGCWLYTIVGQTTSEVPVFFLDTNLPQNSQYDKTITQQLYGGDGTMRLAQEIVLGIGGIKMLRALDVHNVHTYHMNEGHAAFLTLELLKECDFKEDEVKKRCAFTTHTPVKAGHDAFDYEHAWQVAGEQLPWNIKDLAGQQELSMTVLALNLSRYTCGVAQIHGEVSRAMFPGYSIDAITNGVHHVHWASEPIKQLLDTYIKDWRMHPEQLTQARTLPDHELWRAHMLAKATLIDHVNSLGFAFEPNILTIATARRVVPYKRPELLYDNIERLLEVSGGKLQIIHSGNAHPSDPFSQSVITRMIERSKALKDNVRIAYVENYNPDIAKLLVSGADVWLNTPTRLMEASGTSGMKAAMNGTLNLSTLDGWWIEGYTQDHESGWRIGPLTRAIDIENTLHIDAEDIYTQLQFEIMPEYYNDRSRWIERMKRSIALLAYFSSQRCVQEYNERVWNNA